MKADRLDQRPIRCRLGWHDWKVTTTGMRGGVAYVRWWMCARRGCTENRMTKGRP